MKRGWCVWVTGLPGSGKSVVSEALVRRLNEKGVHAQLLSSDVLRKILTPKPSYSLEERDVVYSTLVYFARLLAENGVNVVIDATGNLRRYREAAREQIAYFFEVYLECPLDVCMRREAERSKTRGAPRQIYVKAKEGKTNTVPGVGQPYEPPLEPEVRVDAERSTPAGAAEKILQKLLGKSALR